MSGPGVNTILQEIFAEREDTEATARKIRRYYRGTTDRNHARPAADRRCGGARAVPISIDRRAARDERAQSSRLRRAAAERRANPEGRDPYGGGRLHGSGRQGVLADLPRVRCRNVEAGRRARRTDRRLLEALLAVDRRDR